MLIGLTAQSPNDFLQTIKRRAPLQNRGIGALSILAIGHFVKIRPRLRIPSRISAVKFSFRGETMKNKPVNDRQAKIGQSVSKFGYLLLFAVFMTCCVDLAMVAANGKMMVPLSGYLFSIFAGVAMQFVGAAIPNMRFGGTAK